MKVKELLNYLKQVSDEAEIFTCYEDNNITTAYDTIKVICAMSDVSSNEDKIIFVHD